MPNVCLGVLRRFWPCLLWTLVASGGVFADALPSKTDPADSTTYRRVFVPADAPEEWPVGSARYLPITASEFSRLIEQAQNKNDAAHSAPVQLSGAVYRAELLKNDVLGGTAEIAVKLPDARARWLALAPFNLATTSAFWRRDATHPAALGLWKRDSLADSWGVLVQQSDTLVLDWQLRAQSSQASSVDFLLKIPPATPQTFELVLPPDRIASIKPGELLGTQPEPSGKLHWLFQLAPSPSQQLNISKLAPQASRRMLPRVSQTASYHLEPDGLTLDTTFLLDARKESAGQLYFSLSGDVKIISATIDQKTVSWHTEYASQGPMLAVESPRSSKPQRIEIRALGQLPLDKLWQLPSIRARDVFWTEGTVSVLLSPSLELRSLEPQEANLQHIVGLSGDIASEEAYRFQEWSEKAALKVIVGRRRARLQARTATIADLGPNKSTVRTVATLSSRGRDIFQVTARIAPGWSIESVKATPPRALREWHIERDDDRTFIRMQLQQPIRPDQSLRLEFGGRAATERALLPAKVGQWKLLRFLNADTERQLLLLRSRKRGQMKLLNGLERVRLSADALEPRDAKLLPDPAEGTLIDLTQLADDEVIELHSRPARYHAEVDVQLSVLPQTFSHRYRLDCRPISGVVSELVVQFNDPLPDYTQWELVGHHGAVVVQQLDEPSATDTDVGRGVAYRLRLPVAMDEPFRLQTEYSVPAKESERCNGIRLPEAATWQGQIVIRGPLDGLRIDDRGWSPIGWPANGTDEGASLPVLGCYRLDASGAGRGSRTPALTVHKTTPDLSAASVVAWLAEFSTLQAEEGTAIHVASYHLENSGATGAELVLPPQAKLQEAWINHQQLDPSNVLADNHACRFHFADQPRFLTIVVKYVTRGPALGRQATIQPSLPQCSFPVRLGRWTLWTPEQYVLAESSTGDFPQKFHRWERLFGPLARVPGEPMFHPFRSSDWPRLWSAPVDGHRTKRLAEKMASSLNDRLAEGANLSWGKLLGNVVNDLGLGDSVLVDRTALHAQGIQATTTSIDANSGEPNNSNTPTASEDHSNQLLQRGLALVASPKAIVVTSMQRVAHWRNQLQPTAIPGVFLVSSRKLAARFLELATSPVDEIVSVAVWNTSPEPGDPPWSPLSVASLADVGRSAYSVEFIDTLPTVVVRRAYLQRALWYAVWLLAVVLGSWQLARRPELLVLALTISGAACFLVSPPWLAVPQAAFIGLLAAIVWRTAFREAPSCVVKQDSLSTVIRTAVVVVIAWGVLAYGMARAAPVADVADNASTTPRSDLRRILIPIDQHGNRQGNDVYVPESFLKSLHAASKDSAHGDARYSLLRAVYRGGLHVDPQSKQVESDPWTLIFSIESYLPGCVLHLPLQHSEAKWLEDLHRLDGIPVRLKWNSDGNGCTMNLGDAGMHRLELSAQPNITSSSKSMELRLHVPPMPGAELDLAVPTLIDDLQIDSAGQIHADKEDNRWRTVLAPTDVLHLHWTPTQSADLSNLVENVEQLSWLHIEPSVARLDVQLHLHATSKVPDTLQLETSPQLKLLPIDANSPIDEIVALPDDPGTLELKLKPGLDPEVRIPLRFQLQRNRSLGRLAYPRVRLKGVATSRALFAVSVSSGLSYDESLTGDVRSIAVTEFASAWGTVDTQPLYAYSLGEEYPNWSLRVWPDPSSFTSRQTMRVYCQRGSARIDYKATVDNVVGSWLYHRLKVPPSLRIQAISVARQPGKEAVPVRWCRVNPSEVFVLLSQPLKRPHRLSLRGYVEPSAKGELALPSVMLQGAGHSEIYMSLFRNPDVIVHWVDHDHATADVQQPSKTRSSTDVFLGRYTWHASPPGDLGKIRIQKNNPRFQSQTVTTMEHDPKGWSATWHGQIEVRKDVVSDLKISAPSLCQGPYRVEPASIGVVGKVRDTAEGREITILLSKPVGAGDKITVHLSSGLDLPGDRRLEVPPFRLADAEQSERYILLPTRVDQRSIEWQRTVGLKRESLPRTLALLVKSPEHALSFRVKRDQFFAQERSYQGPLRYAAVRYAIISGDLDAQGHLAATAELVLQPGRASHCSVRLPLHSQLTQLVAGDLPVRRERVGPRSWRIPLGPPFMPRRILVAYVVQVDVLGNRLELTPPEILIGDQPLPLPQSHWQLHPVGGLRLKNPVVGRQIDQEKFTKTAYRLSRQTMEDASALALELPVQEARPWFQSWKQATRHAWDNWQSMDNWAGAVADPAHLSDGGDASKEATPSAWTMLEKELGDAKSDQKNDSLIYPPRLPVRLSSSLVGEEIFFASNPQGQLVLRILPIAGSDLWQWFTMAAIAVVGLGLALLLRTRPDRNELLWRWPHAVALAAGLAWWVLLKPSAVGLLVVALTAASLLGRRWRALRRTHSRHDASTQIVARVT